jgi:hypothetical protein
MIPHETKTNIMKNKIITKPTAATTEGSNPEVLTNGKETKESSIFDFTYRSLEELESQVVSLFPNEEESTPIAGPWFGETEGYFHLCLWHHLLSRLVMAGWNKKELLDELNGGFDETTKEIAEWDEEIWMEPFLIIEDDKFIDEQWSHPDIANIYEGLPGDWSGCGVKTGPIMRFHITSNEGGAWVLCRFRQEDYERISEIVFSKPRTTEGEKMSSDLIGRLRVRLGGRNWTIGGEPFEVNNKELAKRLSKIVWGDNFEVNYSPDVGLNPIDCNDQWHWSS